MASLTIGELKRPPVDLAHLASVILVEDVPELGGRALVHVAARLEILVLIS